MGIIFVWFVIIIQSALHNHNHNTSGLLRYNIYICMYDYTSKSICSLIAFFFLTDSVPVSNADTLFSNSFCLLFFLLPINFLAAKYIYSQVVNNRDLSAGLALEGYK